MNSKKSNGRLRCLPHRKRESRPFDATKDGHAFNTVIRICALLSSIFVSACVNPVQSAGENFAGVALNAVGLRNSNSSTGSRTLGLHVDVARDLNAGADGQGLATVMRLYKLRNLDNFMSTPYSGFGGMEMEKQALGADLVEIRELTLTPGQRLVLEERMHGDPAYLGIVTLFRSPSPQRWRFAFAVADAERAGITIGVHACAMTSTSTAPVGMAPGESALLSSTRCK